MAKTEEDRNLASNARASKMWRTLRIASKSKLNLFDRIDDGNNLQALFGVSSDENETEKENEGRKASDSDGGDLEGSGVAQLAVVEKAGSQMKLENTLAEETVVK